MAVEIHETEFAGVLRVKSPMFRDQRGFFMESYSSRDFEKAGFPELRFLQDNLSGSGKGVLRGMHYQLEPHGMGKLVRVVKGSIFDVAVDLRRGSPTFGRWLGITLCEGSGEALWIPAGFAHGFLSLEEGTLVHYKCDGLYEPSSERTLHYACPEVGIAWPGEILEVSAKDAAAPALCEAEYNFAWNPSCER